jgi:hypothetical protein
MIYYIYLSEFKKLEEKKTRMVQLFSSRLEARFLDIGQPLLQIEIKKVEDVQGN